MPPQYYGHPFYSSRFPGIAGVALTMLGPTPKGLLLAFTLLVALSELALCSLEVKHCYKYSALQSVKTSSTTGKQYCCIVLLITCTHSSMTQMIMTGLLGMMRMDGRRRKRMKTGISLQGPTPDLTLYSCSWMIGVKKFKY